MMSKENEFEVPNEDEILEILKLIDESDFDELRLEIGGLKMIVGKGAIDLSNQELGLTPARPSKAIVYAVHANPNHKNPSNSMRASRSTCCVRTSATATRPGAHTTTARTLT